MNTNSNSDNRGRSNNETGHAKNVATFEDLISFCNNYGANYNPTNSLITIPALKIVLAESRQIILDVHVTRTDYTIAVNERQKAFENIGIICTRVINALSAATQDKRIVADARTILNKIRGAAPKPKTIESQPGQEIKKPNSNSQRSYDKLIDHFIGYLEILRKTSEYDPNESDLTLEALDKYLENLKEANSGVINSYTLYSDARNNRFKILYAQITGLVSIAKTVKQYVKSVYGAKSLQYRQISALEFRIVRN